MHFIESIKLLFNRKTERKMEHQLLYDLSHPNIVKSHFSWKETTTPAKIIQKDKKDFKLDEQAGPSTSRSSVASSMIPG